MPKIADDVRFFSLEEANRTLPLVRRIAEDIREGYQQLQPTLARYSGLPADQRREPVGRELKAEVDRRTAELEELVGELRELGCHFKGFDEGLVDWYSLYAGRPVLLCWKLGEPEIGWWHQVDAGFMGRQPILDSQRDAFSSTR